MSSRAGIQPKGATNNGNLLIPNKQMTAFGQPDYGTDMRAIERWCNSLVAGGGEVETVIFQQSYATTGCGPGLYAVLTPSLGPLSPASTDLNLDFTAPTSGKVKILLSLYMQYQTITGGALSLTGIVLTCVDQATGLVRESPFEYVSSFTPGSSTTDFTIGGRFTYEAVVDSLTPGTVYHWKIGGYVNGTTVGSSAFVGIDDGSSTVNPYGPVLVMVYSA